MYIAQIGRTSNAAEFIDAVSMPLSEQWGEQMETIAQQLKRMGFEEGIRQGKEKWLAQGIEQGIEQGMKASARQIARQLLLSGMDQQKVRQITQLSDEELAALRRA